MARPSARIAHGDDGRSYVEAVFVFDLESERLDLVVDCRHLGDDSRMNSILARLGRGPF